MLELACGDKPPARPGGPSSTGGVGAVPGTGGASPGTGGAEPGAGGAEPPGTDGATAPDAASPEAAPVETAPPVDGGEVAAPLDAGTGPLAPGAPAPGEYGTRAPMLERVSEFAVGVVDGRIYVLGGYPTNPANARATLQIFDPATNTWKLGANAPAAIHHPMIAGVNGKLYSLGGQPTTRLTYEYDPAANTWRARAPMPTARGGGAAAALDGKIYVVGARPPVPADVMNAFEVYDVAADSWTSLPPLPVRFPYRNHLAAAALGGKIYVAGGRYDDCCVGAPMTASLDMFDPVTRTWTAKANMPRPRGGVAGVAANGCFHVYGGEGSNIGEPNGVFPDHDVYNPITDKWTSVKRLPIPFHGVTGGAFVNGVIFMPGGGTSSGGSSGTLMHQTYRPSISCL